MSDERFALLSSEYEAEQNELKTIIFNLTDQIEQNSEQAGNINRFMKIVKKYTDIQVLDAAILRELVEKIVIHEKTRIDGKKHQQIDIYYNFAGLVDVEGIDIAEILA